jgi:hypothetical protein
MRFQVCSDGVFLVSRGFGGIHKSPLTLNGFAVTFNEWQDSLRVESVITKSTHFVALPEYPRNSPHRAAWVSSLKRHLFYFSIESSAPSSPERGGRRYGRKVASTSGVANSYLVCSSQSASRSYFFMRQFYYQSHGMDSACGGSFLSHTSSPVEKIFVRQ